MQLDRLIEGKDLIVTCGAGGVGKTTLAAAIALRAAQMGRKTAVLTVDPAKRLASSLGLESFSEEAREVELPSDGDRPPARLDAMMLDTRRTFDRLVGRYAGSEALAKRILENKFYRHFSGAVGGTHEYTAMERMYELKEQGDWDLLVLDTPPSVHALDFLDAPQRLINLFDEQIFRWVIKPYLATGKRGVQIFSFGSAYIVKTLTRFVGGRMLEDLSEFLQLFQGMFEGFHQRAQAVQDLLGSERTQFLIVTTPQVNALKDAGIFFRELARMNYPFGGFIINRRIPELPELPGDSEFIRRVEALSAVQEARCEGFGERLAAMRKNYTLDTRQQTRAMKQFLDPVRKRNRDTPLFSIPLFAHDVANVEQLLDMAETLVKEAL